jgi:hypothetical protein
LHLFYEQAGDLSHAMLHIDRGSPGAAAVQAKWHNLQAIPDGLTPIDINLEFATLNIGIDRFGNFIILDFIKTFHKKEETIRDLLFLPSYFLKNNLGIQLYPLLFFN